MLIQCKIGATEQVIGGTHYVFNSDRTGRFVCDVGPDHAHLFLSRPEVYQVAGGLADPQPPAFEDPDDADTGVDEPDADDDTIGEPGGENTPLELGGTTAAPVAATSLSDLAAAATELPPVELPEAEATTTPAADEPSTGTAAAAPQQTPAEPAAPAPADPDVVAAAEGEAPAIADPLDHDNNGAKGGAVPLTGTGFQAMTVDQLEKFAKANDVRLGKARRKDDIIALLEATGIAPPAQG